MNTNISIQQILDNYLFRFDEAVSSYRALLVDPDVLNPDNPHVTEAWGKMVGISKSLFRFKGDVSHILSKMATNLQGSVPNKWAERMKAEEWQDQTGGTWTNGVTILYPETINRLMTNNLTPGELGLFAPGTVVSSAAATPE